MKRYYWLVRGKARNVRGDVFTHVARVMAETAGDAMDAAIGDVPGQERISWWMDEPTTENEGEVKELPQPEPERVIRVTRLSSAETRDEQAAFMDLTAALTIAGYDQADVAALESALKNNEVQAVLLQVDAPLEDGRQEMWLIKQIGGWPPQNWTLPMWRLRHHCPTCATCGHKSGDPLPACRCICHDVDTVLLELAPPDAPIRE
ncbi:MAG: hypothetical protein H0X24_18570 [Ktedonobacterales bacterium]|nr:hypothetical protein [Ktedonobacterales bacterium]